MAKTSPSTSPTGKLQALVKTSPGGSHSTGKPVTMTRKDTPAMGLYSQDMAKARRMVQEFNEDLKKQSAKNRVQEEDKDEEKCSDIADT